MIRGVTVTPDAQILVASREGAFRSTDSGTTWQRMLNGLPDRDSQFDLIRRVGEEPPGYQYGDQHGFSEQRWRTDLASRP